MQINITNETYDLLNKLSILTGEPLDQLVDMAVKCLIAEYSKFVEKQVMN